MGSEQSRLQQTSETKILDSKYSVKNKKIKNFEKNENLHKNNEDSKILENGKMKNSNEPETSKKKWDS